MFFPRLQASATMMMQVIRIRTTRTATDSSLIRSMVGHISNRMVLHHTHLTTGAAPKAVESLDSHSILEPTLTRKPKVTGVIQ
jgi:hypothetical protein